MILKHSRSSIENFVSAHHLGSLHSLVEGVWNHISYDDPLSSNQVLITPGHVHWDLVNVDNISVYNKETESFIGEMRPLEAASYFHIPVHKELDTHKCVFHIHTQSITTVATRTDFVFEPRLTQHSCCFMDSYGYFNEYNSLPDELNIQRLIEAFENKNVLFLKNHGALVSGSCIEEAFMSTYMLNIACSFQLSVFGNKNSSDLIPTEKAIAMKSFFYDGLYRKHYDGFVDHLNAL
jgi:ribulose-5-phosphate 4-epimerase/fuculose-1-phosphate aldolase